VLESALIAFWQNGYEGTSLTNLLEATGLTKLSLYAAFGNKESLFQKVVERYQRDYLAFRLEAFAQPSPRVWTPTPN
jgi:AcrR family transcriptional regulator